jgi:hypothetical protein
MKAFNLFGVLMAVQLLMPYQLFALPLTTKATSTPVKATFAPSLVKTSPSAGVISAPNLVTTTVAATALNLNLTSTQASLSAALTGLASSLAINVGGTLVTVTSHSLLTPAEFIAAFQVLSAGKQQLTLGALGSATGGSFTVSGTRLQYISNLVVPQNVTLQDNVKALSISGDLTDSGSIVVTTGTSTPAQPALFTVFYFPKVE